MPHSSQPLATASTRLLLASLAAIPLVACGKKAPDAPNAVVGEDSDGESSSAFGADHDPCSLLEPKEVEAVLGGSLVGPPYRFNRSNEAGAPPPTAMSAATRSRITTSSRSRSSGKAVRR